MNRRRALETAIARSGLLTLRLAWLRRTNQPAVRILAYHRVVDPVADRVFDPDVVSATATMFQRQMQFVHRHFSVIGSAQLAAALDGHQRLPRNPVLITFDDGYRDNYTRAFPILRELGLQATVYVVTNHVGTSHPFWWDRINWMVARTTVPCSKLPLAENNAPFPLSNLREREAFRHRALETYKRLPADRYAQFLRLLSDQLQTHLSEHDYEAQLLSWNELVEMSQNGIDIGSHTQSHPILSNANPPRLTEELNGSAEEIHRRIGIRPLSVAYPVGGATRYNSAVLRAAAAAGYRFGLTYRNGINKWPLSQPYALDRIRVEASDSFASFCVRLAYPFMLTPN